MNDMENSALSKWLKCKVHRIQFQLEKEFNIKSGIKEYQIDKGGVTIKKINKVKFPDMPIQVYLGILFLYKMIDNETFY